MNMILNKQQQQLVVEHLGYAEALVINMHYYGIPREELIQEAYLGLCEAALRWNSETGTSYKTYAYFWVQKMVREAASVYSNVLYSPKGAIDNSCILSLDMECGAEGATLEEVVADSSLENDEAMLIRAERTDALYAAIAKLNPLHQRVIASFFGIGCEAEGICQIARSMDMPMSRIRQIKDAAERLLIRNLNQSF